MKKRGDIYADLEFSDDHSAPTAPPVAPPPVTKRKANGADGPPQVERVLTAAVVEAEKPEPCSEVAEEDDAPPEAEPAVPFDVEFPHNSREKPKLLIGSDVEIAQSVIAYIRDVKGSFVFAECAFYTFNTSAWQEVSETKMRRIIARWDGAFYSTPGSKSPKQVQLSNSHIKSILAIVADGACEPGFFDNKADGINVSNGFLMFDRQGNPSLVPHSPEHKCRHTLKAKWSGGVFDGIPKNTKLHKLVHGCFKGQENGQAMIDLIAEVVGVAAAGRIKRARSPKSVLFHGDNAENGKSQLIKLTESMLPPSAISHVPPAKMARPEYAVKMVGKLLNTANELTSEAIESDAFKHAVTGEPLACRDLYSSVVDLCCVAQHIFAANVLPSFRGGFDKGVRRRLLVIPFNRSIPASEMVADIGRLTGKTEADLVLAWAVAGLTRFIMKGDYSQPAECLEALNNWILAADPIAGWFNECVEVTLETYDRIRTRDAWRKFELWCNGVGLRGKVPGINGFSQRIKVVSNQVVKPKKEPAGMWFVGIKIRDADPDACA